MPTRFLLGPAGSGKTFRCLREVREALQVVEGLPLVFVAPKQATFQLERQLLAGPELAGYTRLHILSFERLAAFVFARFRRSLPAFLDDEGRVMVLRALLGQKRNDLKLFRASARMPGFAQQLGQLLRELQRHQLTPARLETLVGKLHASDPLGHKLHDLALLLQAYREWLREHQLQDADCLLDEATALLRQANRAPIHEPIGGASDTSPVIPKERERRVTPPSEGGGIHPEPPLRLGGLWLDGFAEMTPQELDLLAALAPHWEEATLAFCLESEPKSELSWLSTWSVVARTFRQCHQRLAGLSGGEVSVEVLPRQPEQGRFYDSAALRHLEQHWTQPVPFTHHASRIPCSPAQGGAVEHLLTIESPTSTDNRLRPIRIVKCANAEAEATLAAREVLRFVREKTDHRFRDCAVLVRTLDGYHDVLRRVFTRYQIPFFLDRRASVAHHPLAELTRSALRTAAFQWVHDDWFGALKTGLAGVEETEVDWLENEALEHGWQGKVWQEPLKGNGAAPAEAHVERLRTRLVPPFQTLAAKLASPVSGPQLAESLRDFWQDLKVEARLEEWSSTASAGQSAVDEHQAQVHQTVWQQVQDWLGNVERAFSHEALPLRDWLPILDAGLAGLTVGVIPPVLDQVLIGTIDRSRNPDLRLVLLLGMNEAVFPAAPAPATLLTDADRETLARHGAELGLTARQQIGHERYYGYIACTRSSERLMLTCAARNVEDQVLNPSPFVSDLQRLFPDLQVEEALPSRHWLESVHVSELAAPLLKSQIPDFQFQMLASLRQRLANLHDLQSDTALPPALADKLYGPVLKTAVSRLEQFAACPFKFFVSSGLQAEERKLFELDARERGSFQHEVLARFHAEVRAQRKQWRDLTPPEARELVGRIAGELTDEFREGLFQATDHSLFTARSLTAALQDFMAAIIGWMASYGFDPQAVELAFGTGDQALPAWKLDLGDGHHMAFRGKIDRVDLLVRPEAGEALCVVLDYKSSSRKIDPLLLEHGIQIQLPAYLATLCRLSDPAPFFGVRRLVPAGMFYVNLRGEYGRGSSRRDVLENAAEAGRLAYQHLGRFSLRALPELDRAHAQTGVKSGQFSYQISKDGTPRKGSTTVIEHEQFVALLQHVEARLTEMGRAIYAGEARVDPYRKGQETACDQCDYRPVCRIDPWTHAWRVLKKATSTAGEEAS